MSLFNGGLGGYSDQTMGFSFGPSYDDYPANTNTQVTSTTRDPHWLSVFNTSASVLSQFLASRGRYATTQVGTNGVSALGGGGSSYGANYAATQQQLVPSGVRSAGVGLDDAAFSITDFVSRNPLLVGGVVLGAFLLYRQPPGRR